MIGNNRHSDRTFVSEHICGRLAPSAGSADARFLSRILPRSPPRALRLARSFPFPLDIWFRLSFPRAFLSFSPSSCSLPVPHSLSLAHPLSLPLVPPALVARLTSRRSSPRPYRPPRFPLASPRLASSFLFRSLSFQRGPRNHPLATRSVLVASAPRQPPRRVHLRILLARALHPLFDAASPLSVRLAAALHFSLPLAPSPPFPRVFFARGRFLFLRPTGSLARSLYIALSLVCGTYIMRGCVCVRTRSAPAVLLASVPRGRTRVCTDRFDTRSRKKNGRMYRRRLSPPRVNTCRGGGCARTRHACTGSVEELLPLLSTFFFVSAGAFRIYSRVIRSAAAYNAHRASDGCGS